MTKTAEKTFQPDVPTSEEFVTTMGRVCWLLSMSNDHRKLPIEMIEAHVSAPLMFKQVRVFMRDKQPIAAVIWAYASEEVKARVAAGNYVMALEDWRSGPEIIVVDCVSPAVERQGVIDAFMSEVAQARVKAAEMEGQ